MNHQPTIYWFSSRIYILFKIMARTGTSTKLIVSQVWNLRKLIFLSHLKVRSFVFVVFFKIWCTQHKHLSSDLVFPWICLVPKFTDSLKTTYFDMGIFDTSYRHGYTVILNPYKCVNSLLWRHLWDGTRSSDLDTSTSGTLRKWIAGVLASSCAPHQPKRRNDERMRRRRRFLEENSGCEQVGVVLLRQASGRFDNSTCLLWKYLGVSAPSSSCLMSRCAERFFCLEGTFCSQGCFLSKKSLG